MKALSDKQPWAYLICAGVKDIENRTWKCPKKYIGQRVLIHASLDTSLNLSVLSKEQYEFAADKLSELGLIPNIPVEKWDRGAIIGSVEIVDCVQNHPSIWAEKGVYNWVLANPILFPKPIQAKGKLSFWDFQGIGEVIIKCPSCGSHEIAHEDYTTAPFATYQHQCRKCGYTIMESEWDIVLECKNNNSYGLKEYREGCKQDCDNCDCYQPILGRASDNLLKAVNHDI